MTDKRCKCPMSISVLGDGCRYCQPQEYIDRLHEQIEESESESGEFDHFVEEWRHNSEDLVALHLNLDAHQVPRHLNDIELSAWGRVVAYRGMIQGKYHREG